MKSLITLDYAMPQCLFTGLSPKARICVIGEDLTVFYTWNNHDKIGSHNSKLPCYRSWAEFIQFLQKTQEGWSLYTRDMQITSVFFSWDREILLLDAWADSYKWGRARSIHTPSTAYVIQALSERGIIGSQQKVGLGNWASGKVYEEFGTAASVMDKISRPMLTLYHGTSSNRLKAIQKGGLHWRGTKLKSVNKSKYDGTYLSGSKTRAAYFARETTKKDRRGLSENAKEKIQPVILKVDVERSKLEQCLPDEDFSRLVCVEGRAHMPTAKDSLVEFGSFCLPSGLPPASWYYLCSVEMLG